MLPCKACAKHSLTQACARGMVFHCVTCIHASTKTFSLCSDPGDARLCNLFQERSASSLCSARASSPEKHVSNRTSKIFVSIIPKARWIAHLARGQMQEQVHLGFHPEFRRIGMDVESSHLLAELTSVQPQGLGRVLCSRKLPVALPEFLPRGGTSLASPLRDPMRWLPAFL